MPPFGRHSFSRATMHQGGSDANLLFHSRRGPRLVKTLLLRAAGKEPSAGSSSPLKTNGSNSKLPVTEGQALGTAAGAQKGASWWNKTSSELGKRWTATTSGLAKATKNWKGPEVRVDVDMLKPTITAIRDTCRDVWAKLPPPAQQVLPYVGVGLLAGVLVQKINDRRLAYQRRLNDGLQEQVVLLLKENKELESQMRGLQTVALSSPRSAMEDRMATAIAQATTAAAHAAEAAAAAATACAVRAKKTVPASEYTAQRMGGGKN